MPMTTRRDLLGMTGAAIALPAAATTTSPSPMYGLMGKMRALPGKRAALISILLQSSADMPGCRSYVVAEDLNDPDAIWITEVWDDQASHKASLALPQVRDAIAKARPLIAGFDSQTETRVVGGMGL